MKKFIVVAGVTVLAVCGAAWWLSGRHQPPPQAVLPPVKPQPPSPVVRLEPVPVEVAVAPSNDTTVQPTPVVPKAVKTTASEPSAPDPRLSDPVAKEALGRFALSFVGADPSAEDVWYWTINDPNLPDESRKNLIEDLNEDGLSDPKNPGPQDLPLIANRLRLIAELEPYAMDQINQDAFHEAFKDLAKMYVNLTR
jgi:hypothetical protein